MKKLSIVIPIYNSSEILCSTFSQLINFFKGKEYLSEIIFVDDGSKDNSVGVIERLIHGDFSGLDFKLIKHKKNLGKGASIKDGVLIASDSSDFVFFTDDDLPYGLPALEKMFFVMCNNDDVDIIVGDRTLLKQLNPYPIFRKLGSFFFALLLPGKVIQKYPDTQCGLKGFRVSVAKKIFPLVKNHRWSFDVEVFLAALQNHLVVEKFPLMILDHVKASRFRSKEFFVVIKEIIKLQFFNLKGHYRISNGPY